MTISDEKLQKFEGSLMYRSDSAKSAFADLKAIYEKLQEAMSLSSPLSGEELNDLARQHKYTKYAFVLEIVGLFDTTKKALSLNNLKKYLVKIHHPFAVEFAEGLNHIERTYTDQIKALLIYRHNVVAHAGEKHLDQLLNTDDILAMPIKELIKEVMDLVMGIYFDKVKKRL